MECSTSTVCWFNCFWKKKVLLISYEICKTVAFLEWQFGCVTAFLARATAFLQFGCGECVHIACKLGHWGYWAKQHKLVFPDLVWNQQDIVKQNPQIFTLMSSFYLMRLVLRRIVPLTLVPLKKGMVSVRREWSVWRIEESLLILCVPLLHNLVDSWSYPRFTSDGLLYD